ncbi:MAG TPA: hypothetical protein DCQ06_04260, partial [Myxococcales bacterium]|nr:hypothetical protein [Myxococcales bacterium]
MVPLYELRPSRHSTASQRAAHANRAVLAVEENEHGPVGADGRKLSPTKGHRKIGVRELAILEALDDRPDAVPELPADWVQSQPPRQNTWSENPQQDRTWAHEISVASWLDPDGAALATAAIASGQSWSRPERNREVIGRQDQLRFVDEIDAQRAQVAAQAKARAEAKAKAEAEAKAAAAAQAAARQAAAQAAAKAAAQAQQALIKIKREAAAAKKEAAAEAKAQRQRQLAAERARKEHAKRLARLQRL